MSKWASCQAVICDLLVKFPGQCQRSEREAVRVCHPEALNVIAVQGRDHPQQSEACLW